MDIRQIIREELQKIVSTLDNGGTPFVVNADKNSVDVYKYETAYNDVEKVFYGDGPKGDKDSAILLKLENNKYAFIGTKIYEFSTDDEIEKFYAPIGNSAVPYPYAIGKKNIYFMLDKVYVDREEFENLSMEKDFKDLYVKFYHATGAYRDGDKVLIKKHKMKNVKDITDRVLHNS